MSWWLVVACALLAIGVGLGVGHWSWPTRGLSDGDYTRARADAVRAGLTAAGGIGAAFALLLAVRRQRTTEQVATDTQHDSEQRRVTELYTKAAEMLGAEQAAVRMAGLYALERLAQDHLAQRRPVVSVLCAYLRMPYLDPNEGQPAEDERVAGDDLITSRERRERREEVEVRFAVQRLLRDHTHCVPIDGDKPDPAYWGEDLKVNLIGATLINLTLDRCRVHPSTRFNYATFLGDQSFTGTVFTGSTWFNRTTFTGEALFDDAEFTGRGRFEGATFAGNVSFAHVIADKGIELSNARAKLSAECSWPPPWTLRPISAINNPGSTDAWGALEMGHTT